MTRSKTRRSEIERRQFLQATWRGVGASLALALVPGQQLFGGAAARHESLHAWGGVW